MTSANCVIEAVVAGFAFYLFIESLRPLWRVPATRGSWVFAPVATTLNAPSGSGRCSFKASAAGAVTDVTMGYAAAEKALATRQAYASDWRDFAAWCASRGATALPAHVVIVAAYLSGLADSGRKASTIGRRAAGIGYHHKMAGLEPPTNAEGVKTVLRGIRRTIGSAKQGKAPATADLIVRMLGLCPDDMIGGRDRPLLAFGFAGAFCRSELCTLDVADLTETPDGLRVMIRRSKGMGQEVAIPRGYRLRPVEAVQTWLVAAEISSGPVFRAAPLGGKVSPVALADESAARIVKRYAKRAGLHAGAYSGHSLRSGFLTSAAESGASIWKLSDEVSKLTRAPFGPAAEALR